MTDSELRVADSGDEATAQSVLVERRPASWCWRYNNRPLSTPSRPRLGGRTYRCMIPPGPP
jgi:hypothetical protein